MTTRYHKKKTNTHRHVHRYKVNRHTQQQNKDKNAVKVRSPDGILATNTQERHGDLIKAQVLKEDYIHEYNDLHNYLDNAYDEWIEWLRQLEERLDHYKKTNHSYTHLFEEHDHG